MLVAIRLAAVMLAGVALLALSGLGVFVSRAGVAEVILFPRLMLIADVVLIVGGPIAAVQLWRIKRSGLTLGLIVFGVGLLYDTVGLSLLQEPGVRLPGIVAIAVFDLLGLTVLSALSWRRAI